MFENPSMMAGTAALQLLFAFFALAPLTATALPAQDGRNHANLSDGTGNVQIPKGYSRALFLDDFSVQRPGALPSESKWTIDVGTSYPGGPSRWGTNEVQTYTSSSSNLAITPAGTLQITPLSAGGRWTSARIETTADFDFACAAGGKLRMEASLRVGDAAAPAQAGIWPAFWALGAAYRGAYHNWPAVGEIDILESPNGAATVWQTLHCGTTASGGPCHETTGISSTAPITRGDWHVVAVEIDRTNDDGDWRGEQIVWLVDDRPTTSVSGAVVGDQAAWEALARGSKFLLLNVAVGGSFPDALARTTTPTVQTKGGNGSGMEVKYVAVFAS